MRKCDMSKDLKITRAMGWFSPYVGETSATVKKPGLDSLTVRDQMGRIPVISDVPTK
jgi:hypothetical protein